MKNTYGLLLRRYQEHGYNCLAADLIRREEDHHAPRNISDDWLYLERPKHLEGLALEGLSMAGFVGSSKTFIGYDPAFKQVNTITERKARDMVKTLKKLNARIVADAAQTPEDVFASVCAALRLSFVVESRDRYGSSSYDDNSWRWMTIGEGRNRYRQLINQMTGKSEAA
jgi:hypothetical protein